MKLYPKRKTDEEYVEATRNLVVRSKWIGVLEALGSIIHLALSLVLIGFFVWFYLLGNLLGKKMDPEVSSLFWNGILIGAFGSLNVFLVIANLIRCFKARRSEHLMLKYHDELKEKKTITNLPLDCD
jgi:hypothetical protein